jgi:hypothetical protein
VQKAIKDGRLTHEISSRLWYLDFWELTDYLSNQFADALVGPVALSLHLAGLPQKLGSWTPGCADPVGDANALYKNIALQDKYHDTSKELWQFASWSTDAVTAAGPLAKCTAAQREAIAKRVESSWADKKAAAVVAKGVRALSTTGTTTIRTVDPWHDGTSAKTTVSGADCSGSEIAPRRDGFRCFAGSHLYDPCSVSPARRTDLLCAPLDPAASWTRLTGASSDPAYAGTGAPGATGVFMVKLANGATCRRSTGSGPNGVPGYPYWAGSCTGGPYGSRSLVWRVGDDTGEAGTYPLYPAAGAKIWTAAVETSPGKVHRLPVARAWR